MSGFIRQIKLDDGTPITPPSSVALSAGSWSVFPNDAAYEVVFGAGEQGNCYFNSTELLLRIHNGTEWVYLQNGINALDDSVSTGSNIDLDPTYHNLLKLTDAGVISVRSLDPSQTLICYLANDTGVDITLLHDDVGATAANRLLLPGDTAFTLTEGNVAHFVYDSIASRWRYTNTPGEGGTGGSGQGAKNYVLSANDSSEVVTTGGVVASDTVTPSELPEESLGIACKIIQSSGSIGDKATWNVNPIDYGDNGRIGTNEIYIKVQPGYVDDDATVRWVDATTGDIFGETNIKTTTTYLSGSSLELISGNNLAPEIEFNVTDSTGLVVSGVGVLAQNPLVGSLGGWKIYDESDVSITGTNSWSTTNASLQPYKDPISGIWRLRGNVRGTTASATGSTVTVTGITFPAFNQAGSVSTNTTATANECYAIASTSDFKIEQGAARTAWWFSFDVELASKPTWADFDGTLNLGSDLEAINAKGSFQDTSSQNIPNGTWTILTFNTVERDQTNGQWNGSSSFTAAQAGFLELSCSKEWANAFNASHFIRIMKNGATQVRYIKFGPNSGSNVSTSISASDIYLDAGEYVEVEVFQQEGIARNFTATAGTSWLDLNWQSRKSSTLTGFPFSSQANANKQYLVPNTTESLQGDLGTITNWGSPGTKRYRWTRIANIIHFWWFVDASGGSSSSSTTSVAFDIPNSVPQPDNHIDNDFDGSFGSIPAMGTTSGAAFRKHFSSFSAGVYSITASLDSATTISYWGGYSTWMINPED